MRKFVAGWMSRFGGFWVALSDRIYGPPELAVNEPISRDIERARMVTFRGMDGSLWNLSGGGSDSLPPERRESRGWNN
jgi:hypothetical protein